MKKLFLAAEADNSGVLEWKEFESKVKEVRVQMLFRNMGLEVEDTEEAHNLFDLLDFDNDGKVDLDEFLFGIQRLHGTARSIDIARLMVESHAQQRTLAKLVAACPNASVPEQKSNLNPSSC